MATEPVQRDVYHLFIAEVDALTISADDPVAHVVGVLTRAVKRAQMVHDGTLAEVGVRAAQGLDPGAHGGAIVGPETPR